MRNGVCIKEFRVESPSDPILKNDEALHHLSSLLKSMHVEASTQERPDLRVLLQAHLQEYRKKQDSIYFV